MIKGVLKIALLVALPFMMACEKVVDIPLNEAEREIVLEAVGRNYVGESYVLLSKSGSVYDNSDFEQLSDANVVLTDKDGVETVFSEDPAEPGRYIAPGFEVLPNNTYDLKVIWEDQVLTASSSTNSKPDIDTLTYVEQYGGFGPAQGDTTLLVFYTFTDNGAEENYYRARIWVNGERDNNYYIFNDALFNGQEYTAPFFGTQVESKDTVYVELIAMDEANYTYLFTLANNAAGGGPFAAVPANPVSNIDGGIGYFGTYMIDTMTVIMP